MRHIMVATDGSRAANRAIDIAAKIAKAFGGELSIVTVGGSLSDSDVRRFGGAKGNIGKALDLLSEQILAAAKTRAQRLGVANLQLRSVCGDDPAQSIIRTAASEGADAIVIGRRGKGRLAGLLLGSVSHKIASLAPCSVIIVP
jgi:nucleotide-binding universal stress UspA family protein